MGKFLGVREYYPEYPVQFQTPPGSRIRFGTRSLYVDVPWLVYLLYVVRWEYHEGERDEKEALNLVEMIEGYLREELGDYTGIYRIVGPIQANGIKPYMKLLIKWDRLLEYLEYKAESAVEGAKRAKDKKEAANIIKNVYIKDIIDNFFETLLISGPRRASRLILKHSLVKLEGEREKYKKLLAGLGEIDEVRGLVSRLEKALLALATNWKGRLAGSQPEYAEVAVSLAVASILMSAGGIKRAVEDNVNVHEAYLYMRRTMESLMRLLRFYENLNKRNYDLSEWLNTLYEYFYNKIINIGQMLENAVKQGLMEKKPAEELRLIYSIVSEVIHKIPPLPFYSVLEFKLFKHVLKWYVEVLEAIAGANKLQGDHGKGSLENAGQRAEG